VSCHWDPKNHGCDAVWKALAPIMPDRLSAGHFLSVCGLILETRHPDTGERMLLVEPNAGGWGASNDHDGAEGLVCVGDGETYILPVEVTETVYDILVDQYAYHITEGGEGKYRGGRGLIRDYRIVGSDDAILSTTFTRHRTPPWGVNGGRPGTTNMVEIHRREGVVSQRAGKITRTRLRLGDVARLITGTSGGWGDPRDRAGAAVAADVRAGLVTPQRAHDVYGQPSGDTLADR
jgi:N-methylhydantoinase B